MAVAAQAYKTCPGCLCKFFSREDRAAFEALASARRLPIGALLFIQDEPVEKVFIICSGRVRLCRVKENGHSFTARYVGPGAILGLSSALAGKPYHISAQTLTPCVVRRLSVEPFLKFLDARPISFYTSLAA